MDNEQPLEPTPVIVPASAVPDQVQSTIRTAVIALGGYIAGKGLIDSELVGILVPAILVLGPWLWSQFSILRKQAKAVTMANRLPDSVAQVKS